MPNIQLDKIKQTLERMNDDYWTQVVERSAELSKESERLLKEFSDAFTLLSVARISAIEAKYTGYQKLVENTKKTAVAGIVKENKAQIAQLTKDKTQAVTTLTTILSNLTAIVEELQSIGEKLQIKEGEEGE